MTQAPHSTLEQIEKLLAAAIPRAVKAAKITEPVYCLRIWYNGTDSAEDAVPWLMLVKESTRKKFQVQHGEQAPDYIWGADEVTLPGLACNVDIASKQLAGLYRTWYDWLCDVEDDEALQPFREMIQRVAKKLNTLRWQELAPVTDDFVVFAADGSHTFCDDQGELLASISQKQYTLLQKRRLLPESEIDDADALGAVRRTFQPKLANIWAGIVIGIVLIVGGLSAAAFLAMRQDPRPLEMGDRIAKYGFIGFLGVAAPIGGIALLVWMRRLGAHRVTIFENGFSYLYGGMTEICHWRNVAKIDEVFTEEQLQVLKLPGASIKNRDRSFVVHRKDGKAYSFTVNSVDSIPRLAELFDEAREKHGIDWECVEP